MRFLANVDKRPISRAIRDYVCVYPVRMLYGRPSAFPSVSVCHVWTTILQQMFELE